MSTSVVSFPNLFGIIDQEQYCPPPRRNFFRDHYDGTAFDLHEGVFAGDFKNPNRLEGGEGITETGAEFPRGLSLQRTTYAWVGAVGKTKNLTRGWFAPDSPATSVYYPFLLPDAVALQKVQIAGAAGANTTAASKPVPGGLDPQTPIPVIVDLAEKVSSLPETTTIRS